MLARGHAPHSECIKIVPVAGEKCSPGEAAQWEEGGLAHRHCFTADTCFLSPVLGTLIFETQSNQPQPLLCAQGSRYNSAWPQEGPGLGT